MKEKLSKKTNVGALWVRNTRKNLPNCAQKGNKGITLVALIITIIVLLILAVVAIRAVQGDGIISKAKDAAKQTEIASIEEQIRMDILSEQIKVNGSKLSEEQINEILNKYGTLTEVEGKKILITDKNYEIDVTDIISEFTTNGSGEIIREAGLYDSEENMTKTWEELINEGLIHINNTNNNLTGVDSSLSGKLVIPNGITEINDFAFMYKGPGSNCINLTEIILPDTLVAIGNEAFQGCTGLTSINIPDSVTSIGNEAFSNCTSLTSINVSEDNTVYDSRNNCNAIIKTANNELIAGCSETVIPNSVTSIGGSAFDYCTNLTSITIPDSVTSISGSAFVGCTGLTSITIPSSVTSIGRTAFYRCTGLTSITILSSVTSIEEGTFSGCTSLTSINIPNSVTSIEESTFSGCTSLTSINIPNSVTSIGNGAFSGCTSLTSINIPNSVTSINYRTFYNCTGLTSINIPNSVTSISSNAFEGCTNLTTIYYSGTASGRPWGATNATVIS